MCVRVDSLLKDVLCVHPPVVLGQFDGEDDTGNEKDGAASQTKPEGVLENRSRTKTFTSRSTRSSASNETIYQIHSHICIVLNVYKA